MRRGFTVIEILLVIGILAVAGTFSVPAYRHYAVTSDLNRAADQVSKALHRSRLLSELNEQDGAWGFHVATGTIYKGAEYEDRNANFDEMYPLPETVTASGLSEVSFAVLTGNPSATGSIILTAVNGAQRIITVLGGAGGILQGSGSSDDSDRLTICHYGGGGSPHTIKIPESAWPAHRDNHGDMLGPCPDDGEEDNESDDD